MVAVAYGAGQHALLIEEENPADVIKLAKVCFAS
jgi:hypothetical protein